MIKGRPNVAPTAETETAETLACRVARGHTRRLRSRFIHHRWVGCDLDPRDFRTPRERPDVAEACKASKRATPGSLEIAFLIPALTPCPLNPLTRLKSSFYPWSTDRLRGLDRQGEQEGRDRGLMG